MVTAAISLTLVGTAAPAGASGPCGDYSFGFQGTRLINDGISNSAGPFAIQLPAGTYDIVMQSHDAHDEHPGQVEQTQEEWYFVLDSGYVSPFTIDVPEDANTSMTAASAQAIGNSASITLHHRGEGGVNSVNPVCVGFTATTPAAPIAPEVEEPVVSPPVAPEEPPAVEPVDETPDEVPEVVSPPTVPEPATPIVPDVAGVVETAPPVAPVGQLAVTGPSQLMLVLISGGLAMLLIGAGLVLDERNLARR